MSATKQITIWCDHPDCTEWRQVDHSTVKEARYDLHTQGWRFHRDPELPAQGSDVCPKHVVKP